MKSYTDLEQSKKLAKILPVESADMWWIALNWQETEYYVEVKDEKSEPKQAIPCWSLSALLDIMQVDYRVEKTALDCTGIFTYSIWNDYHGIHTAEFDDIIDACYEMILELHELKLL